MRCTVYTFSSKEQINQLPCFRPSLLFFYSNNFTRTCARNPGQCRDQNAHYPLVYSRNISWLLSIIVSISSQELILELDRMMYFFSQCHRHTRRKKIRVRPSRASKLYFRSPARGLGRRRENLQGKSPGKRTMGKLKESVLPLFIRKFKVSLNPSGGIFETLKKIVSKHADYSSIIQMGVTAACLCYSHSKVKLGLFLTGYTVAMVIHYVEKMTIPCSHILMLLLVSLLLHKLIRG